jgi:hypothetical protein
MRADQEDVQSDYLFGSFLQLSAFLQQKRYATAVGTHLHNYKEVREYFEKEHPKGTTREARNERLLKSHGASVLKFWNLVQVILVGLAFVPLVMAFRGLT